MERKSIEFRYPNELTEEEQKWFPPPDIRAREKSWNSWLRGDLHHRLRPHKQTELYHFVRNLQGESPHKVSPIILNCHRRLGKSFLGLLLLLERCLSVPGSICKYGAPTQKQVHSIVKPNLQTLLMDCPDGLRPRVSGNDYFFRNPTWEPGAPESMLTLVGCDYKDGDLLRGTALDEAVIDESREIRNLDYLIHHVLLYQFVGRKNPMLLLPTTPPRSLDHDLTKPGGFLQRARERGRYVVAKASENRDFTRQDEELVLEEVGSKESIAWLREAECELISDESALVVPEFPRARSQIVVPAWQRPSHFRPWQAMDAGWEDRTAVLFAYVDFKAQLLIIEKTLLLRYKTTGEVGNAVKYVHQDLYVPLPGNGVAWMALDPIRVADATPQQLADLWQEEKLYFEPVEKGGGQRERRFSAIANLRTGIQEGKIRIIERDNEQLIYQLENGIWKPNRRDFERSETLGHLDAVMALVYLYRMVNWQENPFPSDLSQYDPTNRLAGPDAFDRMVRSSRTQWSLEAEPDWPAEEPMPWERKE